MFEQLIDIKERKKLLEDRLSDPDLMKDPARFRSLAKEHSQVSKLDSLYSSYRQAQEAFAANRQLLNDEEDEEMLDLIRTENDDLQERIAALEKDLRLALLPKDPNDEKNVLLEIRAGTGGDEAALFAADMFRMYSRYAEDKGWKVEVMSSNPIGIGGYKEIIALISGDHVYSQLKYESGVHRVQRVPATETQGRVHTSAVTVAVLPEAEEVELNINTSELKFDVFRSSGPGGQSVNTTDSAVRVTHLPTGLVVICQDEKSQHKNKAKALQVLRARLLDRLQQQQHDQISSDRKNQVGSGDRSERVRTYNFPQNRLTEHRINLTTYRLDAVMMGHLEEVIEPLVLHFQTEALKSQSQ